MNKLNVLIGIILCSIVSYAMADSNLPTFTIGCPNVGELQWNKNTQQITANVPNDPTGELIWSTGGPSMYPTNPINTDTKLFTATFAQLESQGAFVCDYMLSSSLPIVAIQLNKVNTGDPYSHIAMYQSEYWTKFPVPPIAPIMPYICNNLTKCEVELTNN